jgi:ribose/xylose/arabinose/galactoside ABC-type transport system permease subunit
LIVLSLLDRHDRFPLPQSTALGGSSLLAGLAGVLQASWMSMARFTGDQVPSLGALGAALLGGASLTDRGGGIAGTVLAMYLLVTTDLLIYVHNGQSCVALLLPATVALSVGVLVSRPLDRTRAPLLFTVDSYDSGASSLPPAS